MSEAKYYFECRICEFDSDEAKKLSNVDHGICPICAGDCGHENELVFRKATNEEVVRLTSNA